MPPSPADRYVIAVPLAIWAISLALPTTVLNQNDWFFPGQSRGIAAAFMSFLTLVLFFATQKELSQPVDVGIRLLRHPVVRKHSDACCAIHGCGDSPQARLGLRHHDVGLVLAGAAVTIAGSQTAGCEAA